MKLVRPFPPAELTDELRLPERFEPSLELDAWATLAFLDEDSPLYNEEHRHLEDARIGWLWTNVENVRGGRQIVGTAEMPNNPKGGKWQRARHDAQLVSWFGQVPDFLITIDAVIAASLSDIAFCALVDHELTHCAQAHTADGSPRFHRDGAPMFALRGHDVEEFVSIVARYGAAATGVRRLVEAAGRKPLIGLADVDAACGNCIRAVA